MLPRTTSHVQVDVYIYLDKYSAKFPIPAAHNSLQLFLFFVIPNGVMF